MLIDSAEIVVLRFKAGESDIRGIPCILDQCATITAEIAKVEEVALSGGGTRHKEPGRITKLDAAVVDDDKDWHLGGIVKGEEVEASW